MTSRRPYRGLLLLTVCCLLAVAEARGEQSPAGSGEGQVDLGILAGRPLIRPTRTETRPDIDGRLDDDLWRSAATITELVQQQPLDGAPASEQTEIYLAYDSQRLYLGFRVHYADPAIMRANRVDRDQASFDDLVTVYLDTFLDQQRAYVFGVNAYGVQDDGIVNAAFASQGGIPFSDRSWDALFDTAAQIVDDGFTAEMAIPFKSLRYPQRDGDQAHRWGLQIVREIQGRDRENDVWAPMSRDEQSFLAQMGVLDGMTGLSTGRNLEILPTFTAVQFGSLEGGSGAFVNQGTNPEAGVNLKYGITSNLTADFAYNPDFSQIESDRPQIDVNQRFPLFFRELRPFFLEGQEIFNMVSPVNLVHTRTIVDPRYGGKLTGKVGKTTLGLIVADDEAAGRRVESTDPGFGRSAQFLIARARYDLYTGSHIGAIVTDREFQESYNRVAGLDAQLRLGRSDTLNITAVQSETRLEDGEQLSGPMWGVLYNHNGRHFNTSGFAAVTDPGFRTDTGFVRRVDTKVVGATASYLWWPENWVNNWGPRVNVSRNYTFEGVLEDESIITGVAVTFARNISARANVTRALERFGGIDFRKRNQGASFSVTTSRRVSFGGRFFGGDQVFFDVDDPFLGRGTNGGVNVTLRPVARLQSELTLDISRFVDTRQGDVEVFDVKIVRAFTTYQFTDRLLLRNIAEYNTFSTRLGANLLLTYRINAGTVFYAGYDDHYQQGDHIDEEQYPTPDLRRTNRAIFTKLQYLFRY
jgi:hypothetical protein